MGYRMPLTYLQEICYLFALLRALHRPLLNTLEPDLKSAILCFVYLFFLLVV